MAWIVARWDLVMHSTRSPWSSSSWVSGWLPCSVGLDPDLFQGGHGIIRHRRAAGPGRTPRPRGPGSSAERLPLGPPAHAGAGPRPWGCGKCSPCRRPRTYPGAVLSENQLKQMVLPERQNPIHARVNRTSPSVRPCGVRSRAGCACAGGGSSGVDLDEFVGGDVFDRALERELGRRVEPVATPEPWERKLVSALARTALQAMSSLRGFSPDDHALVDFLAGADEELAALLDHFQGVAGRGAGLGRDDRRRSAGSRTSPA